MCNPEPRLRVQVGGGRLARIYAAAANSASIPIIFVSYADPLRTRDRSQVDVRNLCKSDLLVFKVGVTHDGLFPAAA